MHEKTSIMFVFSGSNKTDCMPKKSALSLRKIEKQLQDKVAYVFQSYFPLDCVTQCSHSGSLDASAHNEVEKHTDQFISL